MLELLLLTAAISLDGLAVGATYGLRGIVLSRSAYGVVGLSTAILLGLSMGAGVALGSRLPIHCAHLAGACILGAIGLWHVLSSWAASRRRGGGQPLSRLFRLKITSLELVVQIRYDPAVADRDRSGIIDTREAVALGAALGLDALAAGVGAAMSGISLWVIPLAACACVATVGIGHLGMLSVCGTKELHWPYSALPGLLLIVVAVCRPWV